MAAIILGIVTLITLLLVMVITFITAHKTDSQWFNKYGKIFFILIGILGIITGIAFLVGREYFIINILMNI